MGFGEEIMNVCVFGLWHLGLVTAASLADLNIKVVGLDFDSKLIKDLNNSKLPIFEPGLDDLVKKNVNAGNLFFTDNQKTALKDAEYIWVTFDTPVDNKDRADIDFVENQILTIGQDIKNGAKIIISSQVPVGFSKKMENKFSKKFSDKKIYFACSPENLRLGKALSVFNNPDRIVIGVRSEKEIAEFSPLFSKITTKLEWMKTESAEMTKHAINSFLATSVVFANEIAGICESVGADAKEVARGLKTEERIGPKAYVGPGLSFAGGTLARDINFLIELGEVHNKKTFLFSSVKKSNEHHKDWIKNKCLSELKDIKNKKLGLLGLTYKPGTSTLRRSSAVELAKWIDKNGGIISSFDPMVEPIPSKLEKILNLEKNINDVINHSEIIIIGTEHKDFMEIDFKKFELKNKIIIDPTSFLEKKFSKIPEVKYICVGRG